MFLRKLLIKYIKSILKNRGLIIIPENGLSSHLLAKRLKKIILEYHIDCIFDVGANVGLYRNFLREQVKYEGLVISFEPDPDCFANLKIRQKGDNNWMLFNYALGKEKAIMEFHIMKSSVFNSFLKPDDSGVHGCKEWNTVINTMKIETKRLDNIIYQITKEHQFENAFLKLDTQGFDLAVFEGASGCLDQIRGVQTEISVLPIYRDMPTFETSLRVFKAKGFEVSGLYAVDESRFPHAIEFDCIYLADK